MKAFIVYVRPMLELSSTVWNPMTKQNICKVVCKVESVQKRFTKRLVVLSKIIYNRRLEMLNIENLEERRVYDLILLCVIKFCGVLWIWIVLCFFVLAESSRTRGNSMKLYKHSCNSNFYAIFGGNRILNIWNDLSDSVVTAPSVATFRDRLRNCDLSKYVFC